MSLRSEANKGRSFICEPPPYELTGGDYSAIEVCGCAYLAGETWKLDALAKSFASEDPADDIYNRVAADFSIKSSNARNIAKPIELGRQFGRGAQSIFNRDPDCFESLEQVQRCVAMWDEHNAHSVRFRKELEWTAIEAVRHPLVPQIYGGLRLYCRQIGPLNFLCIEVPSKRSIHYPDAHLVDYEFNGRRYQAVAFMENSQGRFRPYVGPTGNPYAWNGLFIENVVQGFCRDIMAEGILRLEATAIYEPVLTVHDEVICRVHQDFGSLPEFKQLLTQAPEWAPTIPIGAKVWRRPRWAEDDTPVVHSPGAVVTPDMLVKPQRVAIPDHLKPPKPLKIAKPKVVRSSDDRSDKVKPAKGGLQHPDGTLLPPGMTIEQYEARIAKLRQEKIDQVAALERQGVTGTALRVARLVAGLPVDGPEPAAQAPVDEEVVAPEPHCLEAALAYAARGWKVFPGYIEIDRRGKPHKKSHKSAAHSGGERWGATRDPEQIRRDFTRWPDSMIGLPTDRDNGFWVLEADTPKGHPKLSEMEGIARLQDLIARQSPLPKTRQAESPSSSQHYYFKHPAGTPIRNSMSGIASGIDTRGEGGMVFAPPSIRGDGVYKWISEAEIAEAPDWLLLLVTYCDPDDEAHEPNEPQAELSEIKAALDVIPIPGKDDYDLWIKIGHAVHAASGGSEEGLALFDQWTQASSEYDAGGLAEKWESFHPHSIGAGSLFYWADEADPEWRNHYDQAQAEAARPSDEEIPEWIRADLDNGEDKRPQPQQPPSPDPNELNEWDAGELLGGPLPTPRQWLISGQFCRSFLSGLVAPGDVGKTTLRLSQAVELATGHELLGMRIYGRHKVLVLSFEDDRVELHRRLLAICKHHGIDPTELRGWLFCRDLNGGAKLAELDARGRKRQIGKLDAMLRRAIARTGASLVILDPFVKTHALDENSNPDMDYVCSALIRIAQDCGVAVDSPAHTHKGQIQGGDADARRGASAQRDAGRLDFTFTVMSEGEAEQFGISPDERKRYMRLDKAKSNITRAMKARWFKLVSVLLGNASTDYPDGDEVQAIERWLPPETWAGVEPETLNMILDALDKGLSDGRRYSDYKAAKDRAAWLVVQKHCPDKGEAQCRNMIQEWIKTGALLRETYRNPIRHEEEKGLFVDADKRPHYG
jgi:hypothetical protein